MTCVWRGKKEHDEKNVKQGEILTKTHFKYCFVLRFFLRLLLYLKYIVSRLPEHSAHCLYAIDEVSI